MADENRPQNIVVVGAGLAGGNAAATLRELGFDGRVVLIGDEPVVPFGRPPLSKTYLRGEEDLAGWYVKPPEWYDETKVELRQGVRVKQVDTGARKVTLEDGESVPYDRLVMATGGQARKPPIPGIDLPGVHVLRTVAECDAIKSAAHPGMRVVVVGMGFIGSEVAASLRQMGLDVTGVVSGAAPLEDVLGPEVAAVLGAMHRDHGVELVSNDRVTQFQGSGNIARVVTKGGHTIDCDLAVVGTGIDPDVAAVANTPIATDNGILVDAACRTNQPDVFAAGDVANHLHPLFGRIRVEHYNSAEKMGRAVARAALGDAQPFDYVHSFWSDQYDDALEYVGHTTHWDGFAVRGSLDERKFLGFYVEGGVLRAATGLNRGGDPELDEDGELYACGKLIAQKAMISLADLGDENIDLRSLASKA